MKILRIIKGLFDSAEPKSLESLEKAKTRCGKAHCIVDIDFDLSRKVSTISGWAEDQYGNRAIVSWSATGLAFVKNVRTRDFDLIVKESYESVC